MSNNIFQDIQKNKTGLLELVSKADSFGWWKEEDETSKKEGKLRVSDQIKNAIESDRLTIGVIGQMKCGKSTFLNAFVFGKEVLPAATTPMTAALTVITYGTSEKLIAEFYTADEWQEQLNASALDIEEFKDDPVQTSKIKAAKDLVAQSKRLGDQLNGLLGKTQSDSLDKLIEYVGAEGQYVSITKSVNIEYPADYLKGVEIVDTPGFNDPIQSREERTKDFLKRADAVLMMLYANQPFSKEDNAILFDNVRKCGVGKVLIAVNKYDLPLSNGETEEEMTAYVRDQLTLALENCDDPMIGKAFGDSIDPICISAQMEMLSLLPMSVITADNDKNFHLNKLYKDFGKSSQKDLHELSNFEKMVSKIKKMLTEDKAEILFRKPIARILQTGESIQSGLLSSLAKETAVLRDCSKPDDQLEDEMAAIQKVIKKANRKIEGLGDDLDDALKSISNSGKRDLDDMLDAAVKQMYRRIDDWGVLQNSSKDKLERDLNYIQEKLVERDLVFKLDEINDKAKKVMRKTSNDFVDDLSDLIIDYLDDFDTDDIVRDLKKAFDFGNSKEGSVDKSFKEDEFMSRGVANGLVVFGGGLIGLGIKTGIDFLRHEGKQQKYRDKVDDFKKSFDPSYFLSNLMDEKETVISNAKKIAIEGCLNPIQENLQKIIDKKDERDKIKKNAEENIISLQSKVDVIKAQLEEINGLEVVKKFRMS